jgi:hypothetical protein
MTTIFHPEKNTDGESKEETGDTLVWVIFHKRAGY